MLKDMWDGPFFLNKRKIILKIIEGVTIKTR